MSSFTRYSNEQSINEVCYSTASLSVSSPSPREFDSHTVVSNTSSTVNSDQFDDAPEDQDLTSPAPKSPLDALAMLCAAEKHQQTNQEAALQTRPTGSAGVSVAEGTVTSSSEISMHDVLCGRGGLTNHHPGNVLFRRLVRLKQEAYLRASKREKAGVAREIVDIIRHLSPTGRFLKKDSRNPGVWIEIGDRKAREKTSQALREGAPELREEINSELTPEETSSYYEGDSQLVLDTMKEHQASTWGDFSASKPDAPERPSTVTSNRVRIVSTDSKSIQLPAMVRPASLPGQPHMIIDEQSPVHQNQVSKHSTQSYRHPQPLDDEEDSESSGRVIGSKRKSIELDLVRSANVDTGIVRGPRLKLLKQRLQTCDLNAA